MNTVAAAEYTTKTRDDGSTYVVAETESAKQLVHDIHDHIFGGMFPNDWIYDTTARIVAMLEYSDGQDESWEIADSLVDPYTSDLVAWSGSFLGWVDDVMAETHYQTLSEAIMAAQFQAIEQMVGYILNWQADRMEKNAA